MIKINFKQPKYIFPLVVFVPLCALIYFVMQTFKGSGDTGQSVSTDRINMELPEAQAEEAGDKMYEMSRRFGDEDAFTAVGAIGEEKNETEELEHGYTEEELNLLDAAEAERIRQQRNWRSWSVPLRNPESISMNMPMAIIRPMVIPQKMSLPKIGRKSNAGAMNGKRQSRADWA